MNENEMRQVQAQLKQEKKPHHISLSMRKQILRQIKLMLIEQEHAFLKALQADLGKPMMEAYTSELAVLLNEIDYVLSHLKRWMKPKYSYHLKLGYIEKVCNRRQPYGSVLIIGPWNYPLQLALMPAISAIAAGNSCVIKPSEYAPETSELLKVMISRYFSPEQMLAITGGEQKAEKLISSNFDFLFFTGSYSTGQKVYQQAAKQLTPVALELGGKNPCIIEETGFSEQAIRQIVWGKFLNAGQTCIAPDTLFVHESIYNQTLTTLKEIIIEFFTSEAKISADYGRIVHNAHLKSLISYMSEGVVYYGGQVELDKLFMEPTILTDIPMDSDVMQKEIFGPILPVVPYKDLDLLLEGEVLQHDALVTYLFSKNTQSINLVRSYMKSTVSVNQVIHHAINPSIPFGGIGRSGFGAYHGKSGFDEFSHIQTYYHAFHYKHLSQKYPPIPERNFGLIKRLRKWFI